MTNTILVAPQDPEKLTAWARMIQQPSATFSATRPSIDLMESLEEILIETEKLISFKSSGLDDFYNSPPVNKEDCNACKEDFKDLKERFYSSELYKLYVDIYKLKNRVDNL